MVASDQAVAKVLGERKPKTARGRRVLKKRESQIVEDAKSALIVRGNKCSADVATFLRELHRLRAPLAKLFMQRHADHPFEDISRMEKMCATHDQNIFCFGSSSKKRPFRIIFGRLFDTKLLDMLEFGVSDFKPCSHFKNSKLESVQGSKPLVLFQGTAFETNENLKRTKSLLLDFFGGPKPDRVLQSGIDQVVVCSTFDSGPQAPGKDGSDADPPVTVRRFHIGQLRSGTKQPRVELQEMGPTFTLKLDRQRAPDRDRWKQSIKVPKAAVESKKKNITKSKDGMKKRLGRIHLGKQEFNNIHTVHHGGNKLKALKPKKKLGGAADGAKKAKPYSEKAPDSV